MIHGFRFSFERRNGRRPLPQVLLAPHPSVFSPMEKEVDLFGALALPPWWFNHHYSWYANPGLINHGLLIRGVLLQ